MRVLFVMKEYLPKPTPPGLCVINVQKALLERGVHSDVVMGGEEDGFFCSTEMGEVYSVKSKVVFEKKKMGKVRFFLTRLPMLFTWPIPSTKRVKAYKQMISSLDERNHYDAIIGTMFPPDVCVSCSGFDHFFYYELDSLINNPMYKEGIKKFFRHRLFFLERKLFRKAELIIHLNHNRKFYSKHRYEKYNVKSVYSDIPELAESLREEGSSKDTILNGNVSEDELLMVYSGHLSKEYRSPETLIKLVKKLSGDMKIKCLFFSRGDCEDEIRIAETESNGVIRRMGYVSQEELNGYLDRADFLLDIGNRLSGEDYSLPSKVISYMATGKPIIHVNGINDSAIEYLEKYGLAICIEGDNLDTSMSDIKDFISTSKGKRIAFDYVKQTFPQNTPGYTADIIIRQIQKHSSP